MFQDGTQRISETDARGPENFLDGFPLEITHRRTGRFACGTEETNLHHDVTLQSSTSSVPAAGTSDH
jgi:hypothetical protein